MKENEEEQRGGIEIAIGRSVKRSDPPLGTDNLGGT